MRKRLTLVLTLALAVAMIGTALTYAGDQRPGRIRRLYARLTEEQRTEIWEMVKGLKDSGASPKEIRAAVREKLKELGVKLPEKRGDGPFASLTEKQRAAIRAKVQEMKGNGASREEIRAAVREQLDEFGVKLPGKPPRPGRGNGPFADLTPEQRAAIRAKVQEMKGNGASREEIRAAMREQLDEFGVKLSEKPPRPGRIRRLYARLSPEQRAEIWKMVKGMKDSGVSPKEIRAAVREKLRTYRDIAGSPAAAKVSATSTLQPASWGQIKKRMK